MHSRANHHGAFFVVAAVCAYLARTLRRLASASMTSIKRILKIAIMRLSHFKLGGRFPIEKRLKFFTLRKLLKHVTKDYIN